MRNMDEAQLTALQSTQKETALRMVRHLVSNKTFEERGVNTYSSEIDSYQIEIEILKQQATENRKAFKELTTGFEIITHEKSELELQLSIKVGELLNV